MGTTFAAAESQKLRTGTARVWRDRGSGNFRPERGRDGDICPHYAPRVPRERFHEGKTEYVAPLRSDKASPSLAVRKPILPAGLVAPHFDPLPRASSHLLPPSPEFRSPRRACRALRAQR